MRALLILPNKFSPYKSVALGKGGPPALLLVLDKFLLVYAYS